MAGGTLTPLQLTAGAALLNNQGIQALPAGLTAAIAAVNATTLYTNIAAAVSAYLGKAFFNTTTLDLLLAIGDSDCPALGNSIPVAVTNLVQVSPYGFSNLITSTGDAYLGSGDVGEFCQGFMAVQGYINTVNQYINSSVNAQTYLGPTFTTMDALVTDNLSQINPAFDRFATDLFRQGQLWNPANMAAYGTPAGLLQQLAAVGGFSRGFFGGLQAALTSQGLTNQDIQQLLAGQGDLSATRFNQLQQRAYQAMSQVSGDDLTQILEILDVTLPNIQTMADLLDPVKTYPLSYSTLQVPVGATWQPIYLPGASVNLAIVPAVNGVLPTASGCDELSKIIPPDQAVANKAIQIGLEQITGLPLTSVPELAQTLRGLSARQWNPDTTYLANAVVQTGSGVPVNYRAQQDVPAGTDITNTAYWLPTDLGGLNTMVDLPLIQAQTTALDATVASYYSTDQATGSGPNGTITTCDVIGLAIDNDDFAAQLAIVLTNINSLQTAGALATLNTAFNDIATAANDGQTLIHIGDANTAIAAIVANPTYATQVAALNSAWTAMASILSQQKTYQTRAGIDYFNLLADEQVTIMGFVQQLPQYGQQTQACGACDFLTQVADTSILGGQALVGAMREGQNNQRLGAAQLYQNLAPPDLPAVTPVPSVTPEF